MMAGNGANCMRIVPYSAVQFGSYNIYKKVRLDFLKEVKAGDWRYKRQAAAGIEQWALDTAMVAAMAVAAVQAVHTTRSEAQSTSDWTSNNRT
jgi:solute carrier family 25 phosphate transporter 23/24/25/41